ncbi:F-type conjugal transfer protein TrbB [Cronobacter sakazakii]|uniref:F-type conjugal transfer protein TrbB n=1 Tax=Cronobacter sakazakii TaxID=28141 RepID=UPI002DB8E5B7|nr:F-type conjugal transfer protein TrbB [Cronobacter sakazakii]MEB8610166.1 F-type conjugal transfer protein TrbB [Cronobacter sakazakii]
MNRLKLAALALALLPVLACAGVREEIAAMEAAKAVNVTEPEKPAAPPERTGDRMMLPDGRQVNMKDYAVVVFMQAHCEYSAKFDPMLKSWAGQHGIRVYPYTLDGGGDVSFPTPLVPRKTDPHAPLADEIMTFFGNGLPIATPTAFMVNVNTLKAYPLTQGVMDIPVLESRYASLIQADLDHLDPQQLPALPANSQVTPQ